MTRALVMGLGSFGGGLGMTRHLVRSGHEVTVTDLRSAEDLASPLAALEGLGVRTVLGRHEERDFEDAGLVVVNPAVRPDHPLVGLARARGARVTSATELFLERVRARVVCVTGTQGKSSTCHLLAGLVNGAGGRAHLGGNIGGSLFDVLEDIAPRDVVVLELSSYQLEALEDPDRLAREAREIEAVAITNVLADHLERHGSLEAYRAAKRRILSLLAEGGTAVLPLEGGPPAAWEPPRGRVLRRSVVAPADLCLQDGAFSVEDTIVAPLDALRLAGAFQRENALTALGLARALGFSASALAAALPRIDGLDHRLQRLEPVAGHEVWDNGVSTTPDSTVAALASFDEPVQLLVGGRAKDLPLDELLACCRERAAGVVCFGEAASAWSDRFEAAGVPCAVAKTVEDAVRLALDLAPEGAPLLFSPAAASFDAYPNFRARALAFRRAVEACRVSTPSA